MARRVSGRAWQQYTKRLEAQRNAAKQDAYDWVMRHADDAFGNKLGFLAATRKMMVTASNYHGRSTSALAAEWFDQMARAEGADAAKAIVATEAVEVRAKRMAIAANKSWGKIKIGDIEGFASAIAAAVAADVKRQATDTMLFNAAKNGSEFAWIPEGGETCAYCIAVAAAGWTPARRATAMGDHKDHIHDNCLCEFAIRFNDDTKYASYDSSKYKEQYDNAEGSTSRQKINSMRRDYYAENSKEIKERQRELYAIRNGTDE